MKAPSFAYARPQAPGEAPHLLARHGEKAVVTRRSRQAGHIMTELAPWLVGGAIIGGITAKAVGADGSLGVLAGAVGAFVLFVLLYNAAGIYRRLREQPPKDKT